MRGNTILPTSTNCTAHDYHPPKQPIDKAEDKRRERFADVLIKAFDRAYADKITKTD